MDPGAGAFSEEQFREACAELQRPALSGAAWELLVETQGISVYRLLDQVAVRPPEDRRAAVCGGQGGGCSRGAGVGGPDRESVLLQVDDSVKTWVSGFLLSPTHLPARDVSLSPGWVPVVSVWRGVCSD